MNMRKIVAHLGAACLALTLATPTFAAEGPAEFVTHHDTIPNFAHNPTIKSVANGVWTEAWVWDQGRVPNTNDITLVRHTVQVSGTTAVSDVVGISGTGTLTFKNINFTQLTVGTLQVWPGGSLIVGQVNAGIQTDKTAKILIKNKALDPVNDPDQWGTGIIVIDGTFKALGDARSPSFHRAAVEPLAGHTQVVLEEAAATNWKVGDSIVIPDTRQTAEMDKFNANYALQIERKPITAISADRKTLSLGSALAYDHTGGRNSDGTQAVYEGKTFLPHIVNETRNVEIRSQAPNGTRGHIAVLGRSKLELNYVSIQDMGRTKAEVLDPVTNHVGRYPLHLHHLWGPINPTNTGYQFRLTGNVINNSRKWPIAIHDSHFGAIERNVIIGGSQLNGAGIAFEDGSETENILAKNIVIGVKGNINPRESGSDTLTPGSGGECYWAAGFNNRYRFNVGASCRNHFQQVVSGAGYKFFTPAAPSIRRNPLFRGADMENPTEYVEVTHQMQPMLEFNGNEAYGVAAAGLTIWHLGTDGFNLPTAIESNVLNFKAWNMYSAAIWLYPVNKLTITNLAYRVNPSDPGPWYEPAIQSLDYRNIDMEVLGGSVHAGSVFGGSQAVIGNNILFENITASTRGYAFNFETPETPGTMAGIPEPPGITITLRNNVVTPWPGQSLGTLNFFFNGELTPPSYPYVRYEVLVEDFQGVLGDDFQAYWNEQATMPIAGGLAPCTDTRASVNGLVCD